MTMIKNVKDMTDKDLLDLYCEADLSEPARYSPEEEYHIKSEVEAEMAARHGADKAHTLITDAWLYYAG